MSFRSGEATGEADVRQGGTDQKVDPKIVDEAQPLGILVAHLVVNLVRVVLGVPHAQPAGQIVGKVVRNGGRQQHQCHQAKESVTASALPKRLRAVRLIVARHEITVGLKLEFDWHIRLVQVFEETL